MLGFIEIYLIVCLVSITYERIISMRGRCICMYPPMPYVELCESRHENAQLRADRASKSGRTDLRPRAASALAISLNHDEISVGHIYKCLIYVHKHDF